MSEEEEEEKEVDYRLDYRFHADVWHPILAAELTQCMGYVALEPCHLVRISHAVCRLLLDKVPFSKLDTSNSKDVEDFVLALQGIMGKEDKRFFFKLSSRSAKDVYPMYVYSCEELWSKCLESERVQEDLALHSANAEQKEQPGMYIVLQPWRDNRMHEYRCIIHKGKLLCMTDIADLRWEADEAHSLLGPNLERLVHVVCNHPKLPQLHTCALDVYVYLDNNDKAIYLQEPNEFDTNLDTMGYTWKELEERTSK